MQHRSKIDLIAMRLNNKLPRFVSPVPDPLATAVDALSLPWEDLDAYTLPPAAILGKVVEKLQDSPFKRIILFAPGWPKMPWFWDLVAMSIQIPLSLPNLSTQLPMQKNNSNCTELSNWPNMPWFWDLVTMSGQIPLRLANLPNLLTQPFKLILHRNLTSLNLHAWLLEPQQSRSMAALRQWQQELRLLKEAQLDQSMRQGGHFYKVVRH